MPEFGRLTRDRVPYATPFIAPLYPPPPWDLPGARMLQVLYEIDKDISLDWLPASLAKAIPPYGQLLIQDFPRSPVGPFKMALQLIVCREVSRARAYPLQVIVDGGVAAFAGLREIWGFPARPGVIRLDVGAERIAADVSDDAGHRLADVTVVDLHPAEPEHIHYDPVLTPHYLAPVQEGKEPVGLELTQVDPDYVIHDCRLGSGTLTYHAGQPGYPWDLMQMRNLIATTFTVNDTSLPWARFMNPF